MQLARWVFVLTLGSRALAAQAPADGSCTYDRCALQLIPRLTALDVVRGGDERRVGSLSFFAPGSVRGAFEASGPATLHADRALAWRRTAAALTDVGGLLIVAGGARAASTSSGRRASLGVGALGTMLLAVSVPLQFRADAELSRAVHEFNRQFVR